jgi:acetylornithine deacetylase/succinyl-diaminopimelate desuccinylase-like protein
MRAVSFLIRMEYGVVNEPYPAGFAGQFGSVVASPGVAEKGFLNVLVEVTAPGGHSSIPPAHTVIAFFSTPIPLIKSS